jgi:Magnesium chelatase, subunit ChlI
MSGSVRCPQCGQVLFAIDLPVGSTVQDREVSQPDDGALFLDELLPEFDWATLEALRHPLGCSTRPPNGIPRAAMSPAASGGRIVEPATEEDF